MWPYKTSTTIRNKGLEVGFTVFLLMQGSYIQDVCKVFFLPALTNMTVTHMSRCDIVPLRNTLACGRKDRGFAHQLSRVQAHLSQSRRGQITVNYIWKTMIQCWRREIHSACSICIMSLTIGFPKTGKVSEARIPFLTLHLRMRWLKAAASSVSVISTYIQVAFEMNALCSDLCILLPLGKFWSRD